MTTYEIDLLDLGRWDWVPGFELYWMEPGAADELLSLVSLLVRGGGRTVLVNTGPDPEMLPVLNRHWANFDPRHQLTVSDDQRLERTLATAGTAPDEVDTVIVTPFQAYAIGNLLTLEHATYALSRRGWVDFHAPRRRVHPHDFRPFCIPESILVHLVTDKWPQLRLLDDEEEILPGLRCFWVGAHHRSSLAVSIDTADGRGRGFGLLLPDRERHRAQATRDQRESRRDVVSL